MSRINRDAIVAICLLVMCGILIGASFQIRQPDYGVLSPATWPRVILGVMTLLSFLYLIQSLRKGAVEPDEQMIAARKERDEVGFFGYWRNVIACFALFLVYLLILPWAGMLIGAMAFVFFLLCFLGGWSPRLLLLHALIAIATAGGMWALFTFGLNVSLPPGEILGRF